jgi:hypothetical protein
MAAVFVPETNICRMSTLPAVNCNGTRLPP